MRFTIPALLSSTLLAPFALAQNVVNEVEPNDTSATAQPFNIGDEVVCSHVVGGTDWFTFTLAQPGKVELFAFGNTTTTGTTQTDTKITLWDATATTALAINDDAGGSGNFCPALNYNLPAGTYLVQITGSSATSAAGGYQLESSFLPTRGYLQNEAAEPNEFASPTVLGSMPIDVNGALQVDGDEDWYQFTITAPRAAFWMQLTDGEVPALARSRYEFRDAAGLLVPSATLGTNAGNSGGFTQRLSQIRVFPAGTYYVVVKKDSTATTPQTGSYRLEMREMPFALGATVNEAAEPNSTAAQFAGVLASGDVGLGNITAGDIDFWQFTLSAPSTVTYQTDGVGATPLLDSTIRLMTSTGAYGGIQSTAGNILATNGTSHGRGTVRFNLTPGTYFLEVGGGTATAVGDYRLEFSRMDSLYVDASYAFATVNTTCLGSNALRPTIRIADFMATRERPVAGTLFRRQVVDMPANSVFFTVQGLDNLFANGGTVPLPFDLAPLGAPNCSLHVDPLALVLRLADANGRFEWTDTITSNLALRGLPIFEQAVVLDASANALGLTVSNWARQIIGDRSWQ